MATNSKIRFVVAYVVSLQQCLLTVYALCSEFLFLTSRDLWQESCHTAIQGPLAQPRQRETRVRKAFFFQLSSWSSKWNLSFLKKLLKKLFGLWHNCMDWKPCIQSKNDWLKSFVMARIFISVLKRALESHLYFSQYRGSLTRLMNK